MTHSDDPHNESSLGKWMLFVFWILLIGLLTWGFGLWEGQRANPNQSPSTTDTGGYKEIVLQSNRQHHYVVNGSINGREVVFLLDTGATDVVIPANLSRQLELAQGAPAYANTANGTVTVYRTTLDELKIGDITLNNVSASINPGMTGKGVLLGMSALKTIEFTQRDGQLTLRQYYP